MLVAYSLLGAGMTGIEKAIEKAAEAAAKAGRPTSGAQALADHLGVTRQAIYLWKSQGYVPPERVIEIEMEYGVDRRELVDPKLRNLFEKPFSEE